MTTYGIVDRTSGLDLAKDDPVLVAHAADCYADLVRACMMVKFTNSFDGGELVAIPKAAVDACWAALAKTAKFDPKEKP